ncbi:MAG: hypothetical protein ACNA7Q_09315 [Rhodobacterales bacterium]
MQGLIWSGAVVSVVGLGGLIWCIFKVAAAKRANLSDDDLRDAVKRVVPINLGALFLSVIGLMMVIFGVFLG